MRFRDVLGQLRRRLGARAAPSGIAGARLRDTKRPTLDELWAQLRAHPATTLSLAPADAVRAERDRA